MTLIAFAPFIVAVAGALLYVLAAKAEVKELGRLAYAVGLLWAVYTLVGHVVRI